MMESTVSHYRNVEKLGGGGMGAIYMAEGLRLGRLVALKILPDGLTSSHESLERSQREARAASALNHPNICTIYEVDEFENQPFIAMELLEGVTLEEQIAAPAVVFASDKGSGKTAAKDIGSPPQIAPFTTDQLLDFGIGIADALDAAHQNNIVHRDIKPANIFISAREQTQLVKILDFALAKLMPFGRTTEEEVRTSGLVTAAITASFEAENLTSPGTTTGTVAYMSPEQVRGNELTGEALVLNGRLTQP